MFRRSLPGAGWRPNLLLVLVVYLGRAPATRRGRARRLPPGLLPRHVLGYAARRARLRVHAVYLGVHLRGAACCGRRAVCRRCWSCSWRRACTRCWSLGLAALAASRRPPRGGTRCATRLLEAIARRGASTPAVFGFVAWEQRVLRAGDGVGWTDRAPRTSTSCARCRATCRRSCRAASASPSAVDPGRVRPPSCAGSGHLQVVQGDEMRSLSEHNRIRLVRVPAARGVVYDRNGELLVDNRAVVRRRLRARGRARPAATCCATLARLSRRARGRRRCERAARAVEAAALRGHRRAAATSTGRAWSRSRRTSSSCPGVSLRVGPRRYYPYGPLAAHLLGYVGEVSESELAKTSDRVYRARRSGRQGEPREGLGRRAARPARRPAGRGRRARAARARARRRCPTSRATRSSSRIDRDLQEAAERALGDARRRGRRARPAQRRGARAGVAARRSTRTCSRAASSRAEWRAPDAGSAEAAQRPRRAGPVSARLDLQGGDGGGGPRGGRRSAPRSGVYCRGGMPFGNHFFRCWRQGGHGARRPAPGDRPVVRRLLLPARPAARRRQRSPTYVAQASGSALPTGIALEHEKARHHPRHAVEAAALQASRGIAGETLSVAIGQGYVTTTPLQMAIVAATIANGGTRLPAALREARRRARRHAARRRSSPRSSATAGSSPKTTLRPDPRGACATS